MRLANRLNLALACVLAFSASLALLSWAVAWTPAPRTFPAPAAAASSPPGPAPRLPALERAVAEALARRAART